MHGMNLKTHVIYESLVFYSVPEALVHPEPSLLSFLFKYIFILPGLNRRFKLLDQYLGTYFFDFPELFCFLFICIESGKWPLDPHIFT